MAIVQSLLYLVAFIFSHKSHINMEKGLSISNIFRAELWYHCVLLTILKSVVLQRC